MLNYYSSNYNQIQKPYNQINIEKITKQINNNRERASSINIEKLKIKGKITNSISKKNTTTKTISVNKQLQYKKKSQNHLNVDNNFFTSYNGISTIKDSSYNNTNNNTNKISKNQNINGVNKNMRNSQGKSGSNNYSNNKLRRKMILSVDMNNKSKKNISQINDNNNNNLKLIKDNKNLENYSNTTYSFNNNTSNPTSNGAKTNNANANINNSTNKPKTISVNHQNQNMSNVIIKSPEKKINNKIFNTCIGISDKKVRNQKNNYGINKSSSKKINIQIKQPMKLFEENSSNNLTTSGNYQVNFTNSNNNEKKYVKHNLKNSNSNTFYKLNHNNNYNNYDTNNYKFLKEVVDIQIEMEKSMKDNPTNSKSKKYNTLKHAFENLLKLLGNTIFKNNNSIINIFLEKILIGYHEVVSAFSVENRKLKQVNYNLNEQYEKMAKDLFNSSKNLKERQKQIDNLQKKIQQLENSKLNEKILSTKHKNEKSEKKNTNTNANVTVPKVNNEQNQKIFKLNEKNLEDLDALYFYDKVKMDKKKSVSIPKILIKQQEELGEEEEEEYEEYEERARTLKRSNTNGELIGILDLKFTSPNFIKIMKAFIE